MILDTNIILRYLIGDNNDQFDQARQLIESDETIIVDNFVVFETVFVLIRDYKKSRQQSCEVIGLFVKRDNVSCASELINIYLRLFSETKLDFSDCYLIALAIVKKEPLKTFDKQLYKIYEEELANRLS